MSEYQHLDRSAFVLQEAALRQNLERIASVAKEADVNIILALKAFAFWPVFPVFASYLPGATASSLNEAMLVNKHFKGEVHVYSPAYHPREMGQLLEIAHSLTYNSLAELERHRPLWQNSTASIGLRFNPEYSPVETDLYNPSSGTGRLGETLPKLPKKAPEGLEGIHVHVLCESPASATAKLIDKIESSLANWLPTLKWLNLGGGHLMTHRDYDLPVLIEALKGLRRRHPHLNVYLEPGSAHAWRTGVLVATVLDIIENGGVKTALLDVSFTCHMPDTLEMPYRPQVRGASAQELDNGYPYRLGGVSCLAGDFLSEYYFYAPLEAGQKVIFEDMMHYTTVKTTMFNGVAHPDLMIERMDGTLELIRRFSFEDYESRMG